MNKIYKIRDIVKPCLDSTDPFVYLGKSRYFSLIASGATCFHNRPHTVAIPVVRSSTALVGVYGSTTVCYTAATVCYSMLQQLPSIVYGNALPINVAVCHGGCIVS